MEAERLEKRGADTEDKKSVTAAFIHNFVTALYLYLHVHNLY